jgi:hypothetical protein
MRHFLLCTLLGVLGPATLAADQPSGPPSATPNSDVGYRTVAEALSDLKKRTDVQISTVREWTIIADKKNLTIWSFAPDTYPAHPAVVKRVVRPRADGGSDIVMSILCEASKEACDNLVREFDAVNRSVPRH